MPRSVTLQTRSYKTRKPFVIARGQKNSADQIIISITENEHSGIGACVPYPRYNESIESVLDTLNATIPDIKNNLDIANLQNLMPPGAARNAVDCALWDLRSKNAGMPVWDMAGLPKPQSHITAVTLSVAKPVDVGKEAKTLSQHPLLKLKLAGDNDDTNRVIEAFQNAPNSKFILDANESLDSKSLHALLASVDINKLALIEQPVPVGQDNALNKSVYKSLFCADESFHTSNDIEAIMSNYGAINIKLDKAGGFTQALASVKIAKQKNLKIMLGCMLGSSLAMAPAFLLAMFADYVDLDGPLLLAEDDANGFTYDGSLMHPATLWGSVV